MYGTLLSNTQIQAILVTLTKSFQDIFISTEVKSNLYMYIWNIVFWYMYSSHAYLLSELTSCIGQSQKKTCMLLLPRKLVVPPKQGHFGWKQSDWSSQLVLMQWKVHKDSQSGTRQTECGIKKRKAIEVFTSQGQLQTHFAGGQRGSWTWDISNNQVMP